MKREIIETTNLQNETPRYRTWFKLYDVIFVSVMFPENSPRKSYFRRKCKPDVDQNKKDNEMCQWHSDWQFLNIESYYGVGVTGQRTYEITVKHQEELHRIDSVVESIAIEFQHTLSVSINEMESRYKAHKELGFNPYLVLDFTKYHLDNSIKEVIEELNSVNFLMLFSDIKKGSHVKEFLREIKKWLTSNYFKGNNLFLDFSNGIVRLAPRFINRIHFYERPYFIENLLQLDEILQQDELKEKERKRVEREEYERKREAEKQIRNKEIIQRNKREILRFKVFKYYRVCLDNPAIKKAIKNTFKNNPEYVSYAYSHKVNEFFTKIHIYRVHEFVDSPPMMEIQFRTTGSYNDEEYRFVKSKIDVIKKDGENNTGIKRMTLVNKYKSGFRIESIKSEVIKGVLHSTKGYANLIYNSQGQIVNKEYYLFNQKVSFSVFNELSDYFILGQHLKPVSEEAKKMKLLIEGKDFLNLIENIASNDLPVKKLSEYYREINEPIPFHEFEYDEDC